VIVISIDIFSRRRHLLLPALVLISGASCGQPAHSISLHTPVNASSSTLPPWLPGAWTREWIERKGARSDLFDVRYLQTPSAFADVRIPRGRPSFPHATSFADLSDAELMELAKQRGFSGHTTAARDVATWHHEIDFQPPDTSEDAGRLERVDDSHMFEHALDGSYVESWRSLRASETGFLVVRMERGARLQRVLLVVGDDFLYVRNRRSELPTAESLESLIASTSASRAQIIEYLDCEFSSGLVRGGSVPWMIERSTLPWREGKRLDFADRLVVTDAGLVAIPDVASPETLHVALNTFARGDLKVLFAQRR
jgi:hypothetical protein